jgi:anti-sigma B factor antagonist
VLNINQRQNGDVTVLDLDGNIIMGGGSDLLGAEIRRLAAEGKRRVLLNFAGVKYLDSSGVGELVSGSQRLAKAGGSMRFLKLSPKVREVMTLASMLSLFDVYEDEEEALSEFSADEEQAGG